ncbi:FtsJ-domain-containing protein [Aulographum hederae CBS 113979]|uniref:FtsJ-domain-containing protein n=1 Tax=Aulographum hederae CBS 113979 TaxID=1176131 RepID=A0A6G1GSX6_9PEZI|nr:FtsJ-domain-containing protein [Aulographum hederae CBS 113979]
MAIQKKHGKGRLDKWYKLAKEKGYRARAAFKLIQLNKRYSFLEKSRILLDLCAAPGSWLQVAAEVMPRSNREKCVIVGVDLAPIKPIPGVESFQGDITTQSCRAELRSRLKHFKADTVLHDGAPNVGVAWVQDAFSQAELVLKSFHLATEFLKPNGTFVTKVFRSKEYNKLLWVFNQFFEKVEATKPPSSRNVSAEIFVVCRGFKAPKRIGPEWFDPRHVFAEVVEGKPNNEAKIYKPEVKKRKRDGYEEGDWTQFKEVSASEFIQTSDPIQMLGSLNKLSFQQPPNGDIALATLSKLPETTDEIKTCCADLKVLGRGDFKRLLRWRLKIRDIFGFSSKKKEEQEEVAEVESMDEEMKIQEDMQAFKEKDLKYKRKERRKENERKQKDIVRMQLNMTTPMEIGIEAAAGQQPEDAMFGLKAVDKAGALKEVAKGKMHSVVEEEPKKQESDGESEESDDEEDGLERQLDNMYDQFVERKAELDAKYRAKRARKEHGKEFEEDAWQGFSEQEDEDDEEDLVQDAGSDNSSDEEDGPQALITDLGTDGEGRAGLSNRATQFFDQDLFKGIEGLDDAQDEDSGIDIEDSPEEAPAKLPAVKKQPSKASKATQTVQPNSNVESDSESDSFEIVKPKANADSDDDWEDVHHSKSVAPGRAEIQVATAEAMTLMHQLATGARTTADLADDNFNKWSMRDRDGLPEWFLDDETQHSKPNRPTTAAAAAAIKEKLRALNARPIKKVREAKARKVMRAARRLEKMKKKSDLLAEDGGMSEMDKAKGIAKMMSKAAKKQPRQEVRVVVARGVNRGNKGRPKGTKGKYKMVDARLKKDVRAEKRLKKAGKR